MKNKKLFLPAIILVVAIVATTVYLIIGSIALKPTVTKAEFPFKITYELDGETVTIEDVYEANFISNDEADNYKERYYSVKLLSSGKNDTSFTLKQNENTRIVLDTNFYADYLMGDSEYDYFEGAPFEPQIYYYDENEAEYYDEETLAEQGVKLISFEYPTPIENSFGFSHLAYCTGENVPITMLIAILALLAIIIFVRKEKELKYKATDAVSIVLNWIIGTVYMIFVTTLALFIDIVGGGPELYYQITYFIPAVSILCLAASVALRRKGYGKSSIIAQLIGPAIFVLDLLVSYVAGLA